MRMNIFPPEPMLSCGLRIRWRNIAGWIAAAAVLVLAGCQNAETPPQVQPGRAFGIDKTQGLVIGKSIQGRQICCRIFGDGAETIMVVAGIHGTESAGVPLVERLAEQLAANRNLISGKQILLVSAANPDGLAMGTRGNARGVDLNRNFEAVNRENSRQYGMVGLSEPETRALHGLIVTYRPDRIISIHQPLRCIDYDGPADDLARVMVAECDLPLQKLGARPGSLGAYAGATLGIPIVTMELPPQASSWSTDILWQRYGKAVLAAVSYSRGK